ncbi:hypothetical protein Ciccas_008945, partial [Cichlidogyrus casuarinus]
NSYFKAYAMQHFGKELTINILEQFDLLVSTDCGTAGSICLITQAVMPILFFGSHDSHLHLKGGTDAKFAPPVDFFTNILQPYYQKFGANFTLEIIRRGFFPQGGGEVRFNITRLTKPLVPVQLTDFGKLTKVAALVLVAGRVPRSAGQELLASLQRISASVFPGIQTDFSIQYPQNCVGNIKSFLLWIETDTGLFLATSHICNRDDPPVNRLVTEHFEKLRQYSNLKACVDEHIQDQIIILMALASGKSRVKCSPLTLHTKSAIYVAETILGERIKIVQMGGTIDKCYPKSIKGYNFEIADSYASRVMGTFLWSGQANNFEFVTICRKDSLDVQLDDRMELLRVLEADNCPSKVLVTHGTDTLIETARFLHDRLHGNRVKARVVLTGNFSPKSPPDRLELTSPQTIYEHLFQMIRRASPSILVEGERRGETKGFTSPPTDTRILGLAWRIKTPFDWS